jgi:protein-tyrosine phosphatase
MTFDQDGQQRLLSTDRPADKCRSQRVAMIDCHSHILPRLDDGCSSFADAIECIRLMSKHGFIGTICTPHVWPRWLAGNTRDVVNDRVWQLSMAVHEAGLEYHLWPGAELRVDEETISWIQRHGLPTLAGSEFVLIDVVGARWPDCADLVIDYLTNAGRKVVLAHPERLLVHDSNFATLLQELHVRGVVFQCNLSSLADSETVRQRALLDLISSRITPLFFGTDLHCLDSLQLSLQGLATLFRHFGSEWVLQRLDGREFGLFGTVERIQEVPAAPRRVR